MHPRRVEAPTAIRPRCPDRQMDALVQACWDQGWWVERGSKHIKCYSPNGERMVPIPGTPSDWRSLHNTRSTLRRAGLTI